MPLRVTNAEDNEIALKKKLHRKMSRNGHYQKVRRPTGLEVYTDAARILEELLEKRIDNDVRPGNTTRRNKSDPTRDHVRLSKDGDDGGNAVARSLTMPSRYRESSRDEELKKKDLDSLREKAERSKQEKGEDDPDSSMDTADDEVNEEGGKRHKKSRFKRAVERLKHVFNRDQKEGFGRAVEKESPNSRRRKPPKNSPRNEEGKRKTFFRRQMGKEKDKASSPAKGPLNLNGADVEADIVSDDSDREEHNSKIRGRNSKDRSSQPSNARDHLEGLPRPNSSHRRHDISAQPSAPRPDTLPHSSSTSKSSSPSPHQDLTILSRLRADVDNDGNNGTPTSSTNGSEHLRSSRSNILDSPGEDIEFMDEAVGPNNPSAAPYNGATGQGNSGNIKYHGSQGLLNMNWLAGRAANGGQGMDSQGGESSVAPYRPDGRGQVVLPALPEDEVDTATLEPVPPPTEEEKEEMYTRVAQRLADIADSYSHSMGGHEGQGAAAAEAMPLTDLENKIIECLRSGGDRNSRQFDEAMAGMQEAAKADAYQRFQSTIQNSLGRELSWDYVAFLFYTTKGVVSAVGRGSQIATQAKEFTLQYITDTCASWLIDQGGFDSMLSDTEETDYELD